MPGRVLGRKQQQGSWAKTVIAKVTISRRTAYAILVLRVNFDETSDLTRPFANLQTRMLLRSGLRSV